jgi:hypothetical protein
VVPFEVEVADVEPGEDHQFVQHGAAQQPAGDRWAPTVLFQFGTKAQRASALCVPSPRL